MALAAGALAVAGTWEALGALDGRVPVRALARILAPLRADRDPDRAERRRLTLVGVATLLAGGWLLAGPVVALAAGAAGPAAVRQLLAVRARRRRAAIDAGAPAVARAVADALAGGHSVRGALAAAAPAVPGAAGEELRRAAAALGLGEPTEAVLEALRRRAGSPAWDTLVAAVLLQRDAGGDLAGLLRTLARRLEEGRRADADARSATAQARFTALLVAALPAGAAGLAELGAPGYLASLAAAPLTLALLLASLALQAVAVLAIRRIARVLA
jgi:tight adherence protein B